MYELCQIAGNDFNNLYRVLGIYEVFCGHKNFFIGKQPEPIQGTDTVSCLSSPFDLILCFINLLCHSYKPFDQ